MKLPGDSTPLAYKLALETRVRKAALAAQLDINRLRQMLLHDRFLARVAKLLGPSAMLKGGAAIELRLCRARTVRDLHLHLPGIHERPLRALKTAVELDAGDGLSFIVGESTGDALRVVGASKRYRVEARLAGTIYGAPFRVDVSFGELLFGEPERIAGMGFLELIDVPPTEILLYPRETHLAEQLHAYTLPREAGHSRVEDLLDLAMLAQTGPFAAAALRNAIDRTFLARATHPVPARLPGAPLPWAVLYERIAQDRMPWENLGSLEKSVRVFLDPLLRGQPGSWSPLSWSWRSEST